MKFEYYTDWAALPQSAGKLFSIAESRSLFFSRLWLEELVSKPLSNDQQLLLACVVDGDNILAILPLQRDHEDIFRSLSNYYTSLSTVLLAEDTNHKEVLTCLAHGLIDCHFSHLKIIPLAEDDQSLNLLQEILETAHLTCHRGLRFFNWVHQTNGQSFENYMANRPSKLRNTIARKQRKLLREHGYDIRLFTNNDLTQAITDYSIVFKKSWKGGEAYKDLINNLVFSLSKPGWLRLGILYIDGKPVAAQIWLVAHANASIFRLAYDEAWKRYSPGSILTHYMMEYVIDTDKVKEIDFLTGNDRYKQDWMSERRARWGLSCADRRKPKNKVVKTMQAITVFLKKLIGSK